VAQAIREPALQVQSPEFKHQSYEETETQTNKQKNLNYLSVIIINVQTLLLYFMVCA
jgi:hypothetical protein